MSTPGRTRVERAWEEGGVLAALLRPLALPYGAVIACRNRLYDRELLPVHRVRARVVSVGNVLVGGTGKTPLALWLATELARAGRRPAIVARGYGKRRRGVVVVSEGGGPCVSASEGGDEAVMMAHRFDGPVVTGEDRVTAARRAIDAFGVDIVVLDDGFQHRRLARDVDVVVMPGTLPPHRLLPAGRFRESLRGLARAGAVVVVDGDGRARAWGRDVLSAQVRAEGLVEVTDGRWRSESLAALAGSEAIAVAGIARPERFHAMLGELGARVVETISRPDHHPWSEEEVAAIASRAGSRLVVTTEKDLVKWGANPPACVRALRVGIEVAEPSRLVGLARGPDVLCEDPAG